MGNGNDRVLGLFLAALDAAGGLGAFVQGRRLEWLPPLMQAAFIVSQQEHEHRTIEAIADDLGVPRDLVESVLSAPLEATPPDLQRPPPRDAFTWSHVAGGMAKRAYHEPPQP